MLSAMLRPVSPTSLVCAKVDWIPFLSKFGAGDFGVEGGQKKIYICIYIYSISKSARKA